MKHRKMSPLEAILKVQTLKPTTVVSSGRRISDREKFDIEEREEAEQKLQRAIDPQRKELAQAFDYATESTAQYWSNPSVSKIAADLQKGYYYPDMLTAFPQTTVAQSGSFGKAQFVAFLDQLPQSGFTLSETGKQRLLLFVLSNALGNGANLSSPETYRLAFDRLLALRCFEYEGSTELGYDETQRVELPAPSAPPAAPLTIDDLEGIDCSSPAARDIIHTAVFGHGGEAKVVWDQWIQFLEREYNFVPTAVQQKAAIDWFTRNQKSFLHGDSYNECRRYMTKMGIAGWPPNQYTPDEAMAISIENTDSRSYDAKQTLGQKLAMLASIQRR